MAPPTPSSPPSSVVPSTVRSSCASRADGVPSPTLAADVAAVVGGQYARDAAAENLPEEISVSSQLHNFHVALGWRWVAFQHLVIRANVGYTQTVGSSSEVEIPGQSELSALANPTVDATLDDIYTSYVKLPVLGVSGGYRF